MLKILRHKGVSKIVLWAILILILPAFVIWGTGSMGRSRGTGPKFVGLIGDKKVTFDAFADSLTCVRAQILLSFFNQREILEALLKNNEFLGKMAWDRLIMISQTKKEKIRISNNEVVNFVRKMPIFIRGDKFDERIYGYVLRNNLGMAPRAFEEMMRNNLAIQKLHDMLAKDVKVSDEEVLERYRTDNGKFKVAYAVLPVDAEKTYQELIDTMVKNNMTFEQAVQENKLILRETPFFSKPDYVEGLGEAGVFIDPVAKLGVGEVSGIIATRKGLVIFKLLETQKPDEEKFAKEKEVYSQRVLTEKKSKLLEGWLKSLESQNVLNIDLKDYEQYYK